MGVIFYAFEPPSQNNVFFNALNKIHRITKENRCIEIVIKMILGASLVAQWLRVCLPMQGTRVRALVWEDPTCRGATRPVNHNY